ncbi:MAG: hypothetical protein IIX61_05510 [Loktanella sp.]|nr:hypothetical protein [Loktanella sp.]
MGKDMRGQSWAGKVIQNCRVLQNCDGGVGDRRVAPATTPRGDFGRCDPCTQGMASPVRWSGRPDPYYAHSVDQRLPLCLVERMAKRAEQFSQLPLSRLIWPYQGFIKKRCMSHIAPS